MLTLFVPNFVVAKSLNSLHGKASGEVVLPKRLLWNPSRSFNMEDKKRVISLLRIVLRESRTIEDLETYVNEEKLLCFWNELKLPEYIKNAWEQKFPELVNKPEN
jgi:hypothetical protein